jgi:hypothetical protein
LGKNATVGAGDGWIGVAKVSGLAMSMNPELLDSLYPDPARWNYSVCS